ncbi:hypothetical protein ACVINW_004075 [Bradyrhizobium sp. USDA 4461]
MTHSVEKLDYLYLAYGLCGSILNRRGFYMYMTEP